MIALTVLIILCHLATLICNLYRGSSSTIQKLAEACVAILGAIAAGLSLIPVGFAAGLSFSFIGFALMIFLNTVRYGMKEADPEWQFTIYGVSGLGIILTIIASIIWYCV